MDRPAMQVPPLTSLNSSVPRSSMLTSEKFLTEVEREWTQPVIIVRKILQGKPVECSMRGNLHRVKLIQFAEAKISGTILIRVTQEEMGIIKYLTTLFRKKLEMRSELMGAWRLRDTENSSSLLHFDSLTTPFKIMNILV